MLRSMLLGDPHVEPSVSVSSLLNKTEKMSPTENTETLTVREAITVQETSTRDKDSVERDSTPQRSIAAASPARRSAFKLSQKEKEPESEPEPEPEPAVEAEPPRPSDDKDKEKEKDAAEPATDGADDDVVPEKAQPTKDAREAVNGDDSVAAVAETSTRSTKSRASKERAEPAEEVDDAAKEKDAAPKPAASSEDAVFEIERLATHRVNKETSTVDFYVEWVGTATSWEPERELQSQVPDLVFEYWDAQGGREKATGLEEFHVFRILDSAVDPPSYRVQWVGYRDTPADTTWEPRSLLRRVAPIALGLYDSTNKKRTAKGRPGRPSKKAKTARSADQ
ncbi:hypothetical protein HJFPF1_10203 [Paramyrothecium foliicola]|nr:hypothetical protein HJFPF1_10203 [Paramyrothecium foliicola]